MKFLDEKGVQHLWSKVSMEDYPNNETLIAVLNAIDQTKANKEEIPSKTSQLENDSKFVPENEVKNLLGPTDFELAASKNITIELITTNYVEDRRLSEIANKADKSYVDIRVPAWTESDEGKTLKIVNGTPTWA